MSDQMKPPSGPNPKKRLIILGAFAFVLIVAAGLIINAKAIKRVLPPCQTASLTDELNMLETELEQRVPDLVITDIEITDEVSYDEEIEERVCMANIKLQQLNKEIKVKLNWAKKSLNEYALTVVSKIEEEIDAQTAE